MQWLCTKIFAICTLHEITAYIFFQTNSRLFQLLRNVCWIFSPQICKLHKHSKNFIVLYVFEQSKIAFFQEKYFFFLIKIFKKYSLFQFKYFEWKKPTEPDFFWNNYLNFDRNVAKISPMSMHMASYIFRYRMSVSHVINPDILLLLWLYIMDIYIYSTYV